MRNSFYGAKISQYGLDNGFVDYGALRDAIHPILNNSIMQETLQKGFYWNEFNGCEWYEDEDGEEHFHEVYQYYIISGTGANLLREETEELVWYCEELELYVWGVTHWGTAWDYVLTNIEIEKEA